MCGGEGHSKLECTSAQAYCLNCSEAHPIFSCTCIRYKLVATVLNLKHRDRLSFPEARRQVHRLPSFAGFSYASVVRSSSPRPSRLPQSHNHFHALDQDTPTTTSPVSHRSVPEGPSPGSLSRVPLLSTQSVMSPVCSFSSPTCPPSRHSPSLGSPRHLTVQADVHCSPGGHVVRSPGGHVVRSRSSSPIETLESVAQYIAAGTPVSLSQKRKPGSSPFSSPVGKKASLFSSPPISDSIVPSLPALVVEPPVPTVGVSLAPSSVSVTALAEVRSPSFCPSSSSSSSSYRSCPSTSGLSPHFFRSSFTQFTHVPRNPDFADPDPDPVLL
ncbi:uncharacterized protein [Procambarus clarkii]|uniref:uncharacterized protein n=1 Tax=Procambarus clarkii TaxID=6728 RepID=UPI0037446B75